jgi:hypothetical protein
VKRTVWFCLAILSGFACVSNAVVTYAPPSAAHRYQTVVSLALALLTLAFGVGWLRHRPPP